MADGDEVRVADTVLSESRVRHDTAVPTIKNYSAISMFDASKISFSIVSACL